MRWLALGLLIALAGIIMMQPALAQPDMICPFITVAPDGCGPVAPFYALQPSALGVLIINEFNTSRLAMTDSEAFALNFPGPRNSAVDDLFAAPTPALAQTSSGTIVASRTYFFSDFFG